MKCNQESCALKNDLEFSRILKEGQKDIAKALGLDCETMITTIACSKVSCTYNDRGRCLRTQTPYISVKPLQKTKRYLNKDRKVK